MHKSDVGTSRHSLRCKPVRHDASPMLISEPVVAIVSSA
jgi:hypothetical protein